MLAPANPRLPRLRVPTTPDGLPLQDLEAQRPGRGRRRSFKVTLDRFLAWASRRWPIGKVFEAVPDGRDPRRVTIPLPAVLKAGLCMFVLQLGSVLKLDQLLADSPVAFRTLLGLPRGQGISDDAFADALQASGPRMLRPLLSIMGTRELQRWKAGRYRQAVLSRRILAISPHHHWLASRVVVAIDGHELFAGEHHHCPRCLTRKKTKKVHGQDVEVVEYYHRAVVAQLVGTHPATVLEFEELRPGDNELKAAYRLMIKLGRLYGNQIDILVADALYDGQPFRALCSKLGYHWVTRQKNEGIDPGRSFRNALAKRDPELQDPDSRYLERDSHRSYEVWQEASGGYRFVYARRTTTPPPNRTVGAGAQKGAEARKPAVHQGACMSNLPADTAPAVAVAMVMEARWGIEDTGFHELATAWKLDRPYVHAHRSVAVTVILILAFVAYNAMQSFFYRELGISPDRPERTIGAICMLLLASIGALRGVNPAWSPDAGAPPTGTPGPGP